VSESDYPASTGPAAAATLAVGIGALVLGLLTTLNEASTSVHDFLEFNERVGPLSGKTIFAVIAFFVSWGVLAALWRRTSPPLRTVLVAAAVLIGLGLLGTFPIFFQAFASE
jgi:hypothetical protein